MKLERSAFGFEVKFAPESGAKTGTFSGYGSTFNGPPDSYGDVIAPGAFKASLKEWGKRKKLPPMLLQHGGGMFGGSTEDGIPVGVWTEMEEDDKGLKVTGELFGLDTQKGTYIYEGLKSGALDGLSIGFIAREVAYGKKPEEPPRTLKKIDLMELSIVTFPANTAARITDAKSIEELKTLSDAERYLRDAGFSRQQALAFVSKVKSCLRPSDSETAKVVEAAQRAGARLLSQISPTR